MGAEKQKTILLVDDETIIAMAEKITLEKFGYEVIIANNGEEAVAVVEKSSAIDLILMDINLGTGMDGTEAAMIILSQRDLPVVFLSSHMEPEVVAKTEKITSYGYVVKASSGTVLDASIKMAFKLFEAKTKEQEKESQMEAALEALQESEEQYHRLVEGSPDAIAVHFDGKFVFVNSAGVKLIGAQSPQELIGRPILDVVHPDSRSKVVDRLRHVTEGNEAPLFEEKFMKFDGSIIDVEVVGIPFPYRGQIATQVVVRDITERKQAESQNEAALEALRESEERQQLILATLPIAIYISPIDPEIDSSWISGDVEKVTGFTVDQYMAEKDFWRNRLHADDRERVLDTYKNQAASEDIVLEYRWLCKDGNYKWFYDRAIKKRTRQGIQYFGIILDITERKQAEAALRESEERYRSILRASPNSIALTDLGGRIIMISPAALTMFACQREEEMLGHLFLDFVAPGDRERALSILSRISQGTETGLGEYRGLRMDGSAIDVEVNGGFVLGADGRPTHIVFVIRDITDRNRAEAEIKRQLSEKEILLKEVHHRIKNNIASIGGLLSLRLQSITNSEAVAVLQDTIGRVDSMRILYDKLLLSEDYEDLSVKNYIESLANSIIALFPGQKKVVIEKRITDFQLDSKRSFLLGIITNEILTNKMKYAFSEKDSGLIKISLTHVDKHVTLTIQDNGRRLPDGFDINESKGFGLMLVKMLSQQLGGSFSMDKHKGTRCLIEFET